MEIILWFVLFLILWTISSIIWFFALLGEKYRKNKWYDFFLSPPVLLIAYIIGVLRND